MPLRSKTKSWGTYIFFSKTIFFISINSSYMRYIFFILWKDYGSIWEFSFTVNEVNRVFWKRWGMYMHVYICRYIYVCISIYKMDTYLPSNRSTYEHAHMHEYIFPSKNKTLLPMYTYTDSYIIKYTMQSSHLQWIHKHIQTQKVSSTQEY